MTAATAEGVFQTVGLSARHAFNGPCDPRAPESCRSKRFLTALQSGGPEFKRVLAEPTVWEGRSRYIADDAEEGKQGYFPPLGFFSNVSAAATSVKTPIVSLRKWSHGHRGDFQSLPASASVLICCSQCYNTLQDTKKRKKSETSSSVT